MSRPPLVLIESPYKGDVLRNKHYARLAMRDAFLRGEYPFASHLLYTQPNVLEDSILTERMLGIEAGLAWGAHAQVTVVYTDYGITGGMQQGIDRAHELGRPVVVRNLWAGGRP